MQEGGPSEIAIVFCRLRSIVNDSLSAERTFSMTSSPYQDTAAFYTTAVYNTTLGETPNIHYYFSKRYMRGPMMLRFMKLIFMLHKTPFSTVHCNHRLHIVSIKLNHVFQSKINVILIVPFRHSTILFVSKAIAGHDMRWINQDLSYLV